MRKIGWPLLAACILFACSRSGSDEPETPPPPPDNGPLGGTYTFTGSQTKLYDTFPGTGVLTMEAYTTTTTNLKGKITVTKTNIASEGLMYNFTTTGTRKDRNTATGLETTSNATPESGNRGKTTDKFNSNYTIVTASTEITVNDAQYLFNPAFILLPAGATKWKYSLQGKNLTVTWEHYDAANRRRTVQESGFQKQ